MTHHETMATETVSSRHRTFRDDDDLRVEPFQLAPMEVIALGVAVIMTLGPLFAYAIGLGPR